MKKTFSGMWRSGVAFFLALCMVASFVPFSAFATEVSDVNDDGVINYVSLGASNVNGYGMHGYLDEDVYEYPLLKENANIYGYKQDTPGSYPVLVKEYLEGKGHTVNLSQLAISSMRAEEVRFLLDDSYTGDAYTDWRFCDVPGYTNRNSQNWFYLAGKLEWEAQGNTGTPTQEQAVAALKEAYRKAISEADLITVDIGINNFGVYASNQIVSKMYENDLNTIDPELAAIYAEGKAYVMSVLEEMAGDLLTVMPVDALNHMADTMAYALVGFCLSFDAVMEQIRALNPDATVTVVSIQNLMYGLKAQMPGFESELPFGDIFGALINAANVYTATVSEYSDTYTYADVRKNGRVEFFSDELLGYNGDPSTLGQDMKDCFDVYDNDLYIKSRVQQLLAKQLYSAGLLDISAAVAMGGDIANNLEHFAIAYQNDLLVIPALGNATLKQFFDAGAAGQLPAVAQPYYDGYVVALNTAYDVMAEIFQAGLELDTLDATSFGQNFGPVEDGLLNAFFGTLENAVMAAIADPSFSFDLNDYYPNGIYKTLAAQVGLPEGFVNTVAALGIRTGIGNSFFGHPNGNGQVQLKDAVINAIENDVTGKDVVTGELELILDFVLKVLEKHGPEIAEKVWNQWVEYGYVDAVNDAIADLKTQLQLRYDYYVGEALPAIETAIENLVSEKDGLVAELANLKAQLEAKKAELEKVIGEQEIGSVTGPNINIDVNAPVHGDKVPENDCVVEGETAEAELEAAIRDLEHAIAVVEALIADATADIEAMIDLAAQIAEAAKEIGRTISEVAAAAEDVKEAIEAIAAVLTKDADLTLGAIADTFEAARKTALAAAEVLKLSAGVAEDLVSDAEDLMEGLVEDVEALYNKFVAELPGCIEQIPYEAKAAAALTVYGILNVLEENKDALKAELIAGLKELAPEYAEEIDLIVNDSETLKQQIKDEIQAKYDAAVLEILAQYEENAPVVQEKYENAQAALQAKAAELKGEAAAKIAALQAELKALEEELKNTVEAGVQPILDQIARVKADIATVEADLECALEHLFNAAMIAYEQIVEEVKAAYAEAVAALKAELEALKEAIIEDTAAALNALANKAMEAVMDIFASATTADLVIDHDFQYVAIGDGSAAAEGYAEELAKALNALAAANGVSKIDFVNNAKVGNTVAAERADLSDISKADLITIGFSNVTFLSNALQNKVTLDWAGLVGEKGAEYVEELMADLEAELAAAGLNEETVAYASGLIEACAYSIIEYAIELPGLIGDIKAINPEALIVIVGMYNPLEGVVLNLDGTTLEIAEYVDYLVEAVAVYGVGFALLTGDAIYVDARDVATANTDKEITMFELLTMAVNGFEALYPNAEGDAYIAEQILNALNISFLRNGLLGDANSDGIVDSYDAALILQFDVGAITADQIDLTVCDVDGDGIVDSYDATLILQFDVGMITKFPAA